MMTLSVVIDSREQRPLDFGPDVTTITGTLSAGDYSLQGFEEHAAIERKELGDLLSCITTERARFKRELLRLRSYPCRAVVVEATLADILSGDYRSKVHPSSVLGSIASWMTRYKVPFVFAGDRTGAAAVTLALLRTYRDHVRQFVRALNVEGAQ
jgi:ERCC4-type nuclease